MRLRPFLRRNGPAVPCPKTGRAARLSPPCRQPWPAPGCTLEVEWLVLLRPSSVLFEGVDSSSTYSNPLRRVETPNFFAISWKAYPCDIRLTLQPSLPLLPGNDTGRDSGQAIALSG